MRFPLGVDDILRLRVQGPPRDHSLDDSHDLVRDISSPFDEMLQTPVAWPETSTAEPLWDQDLLRPASPQPLPHCGASRASTLPIAVPDHGESPHALFTPCEPASPFVSSPVREGGETAPQAIINWKVGAVGMLFAALLDIHGAGSVPAPLFRRKQTQSQTGSDEAEAD